VLLDGAMIGIDAAELRHLIAIDKPVTVTDSNGNQVEEQDSNGDPLRTWELLAEVHAKVDHLKANEIIALQTVVGAMDTRFVLRYDAVTRQITALHRIRYDGIVFNITGPENIEHRGILLKITARSGVNDG